MLLLLLLPGRLVVVLTSDPALLRLPDTTVLPLLLLRLLLSSITILSQLLLLSSTTNLSLLLRLLSRTTKLSLLLRLLLSGTTKSLPPAIGLKTTANGESVRVHRRRCCRHDRLQLPLLQHLGLAVSVGGTDNFLHL